MSSLRSLIQDAQSKCDELSPREGDILAPVIKQALAVCDAVTDESNFDHALINNTLGAMDSLIRTTRAKETDPAPFRGLIWVLLRVTHASLHQLAKKCKRDEADRAQELKARLAEQAERIRQLEKSLRETEAAKMKERIELERRYGAELTRLQNALLSRDEHIAKLQEQLDNNKKSLPSSAPRRVPPADNSGSEEEKEKEARKAVKRLLGRPKRRASNPIDEGLMSDMDVKDPTIRRKRRTSNPVDYAKIDREGTTEDVKDRPKRRSANSVSYAKMDGGVTEDEMGEEDKREGSKPPSRPNSRASRVDSTMQSGVVKRARTSSEASLARTSGVKQEDATEKRTRATRSSSRSSSGSPKPSTSKRTESPRAAKTTSKMTSSSTPKTAPKGRGRPKKEKGEGEKETKKPAAKRTSSGSKKKRYIGYAYVTDSSDEGEKEEKKKPGSFPPMKCKQCEFNTHSVFKYTKHLDVQHQTTMEKEGLWFKCECGHMGRSTNHSSWNQCGGKRTKLLFDGKDEEESEEESDENKDEGSNDGDTEDSGDEETNNKSNGDESTATAIAIDEVEEWTANPQCFLCEAHPPSCVDYERHITDAHQTSLAKRGYWLQCACSARITSRQESVQHSTSDCPGDRFHLKKKTEKEREEEGKKSD